MNLKSKFKNIKVLKDIALSNWNTLKLGGVADEMFFVENEEELNIVIDYCSKEQKHHLIVGSGSNLLFTDAGFKGVIIKLTGDFNNIEINENIITAGAGVKLSELIYHCRQKNKSSLECLYGIPGTLGGAVSMNAGSKWGTIDEVILKVKTPGLGWREVSEDEFQYRNGILNVITFVQLKCKTEKREKIENVINEIGDFRKTNQPEENRTAGSIYKNPPGQFAGRLIDMAGWRGRKIKNVLISEKHANHIIPMGKTTADEYINVLALIRKDVFDKYSVLLEPEIRIYKSNGELYEF